MAKQRKQADGRKPVKKYHTKQHSNENWIPEVGKLRFKDSIKETDELWTSRIKTFTRKMKREFMIKKGAQEAAQKMMGGK